MPQRHLREWCHVASDIMALNDQQQPGNDLEVSPLSWSTLLGESLCRGELGPVTLGLSIGRHTTMLSAPGALTQAIARRDWRALELLVCLNPREGLVHPHQPSIFLIPSTDEISTLDWLVRFLFGPCTVYIQHAQILFALVCDALGTMDNRLPENTLDLTILVSFIKTDNHVQMPFQELADKILGKSSSPLNAASIPESVANVDTAGSPHWRSACSQLITLHRLQTYLMSKLSPLVLFGAYQETLAEWHAEVMHHHGILIDSRRIVSTSKRARASSDPHAKAHVLAWQTSANSIGAGLARVQPHYRVLGTKTGRIFSSRPNVQAIPRLAKDKFGIRRCIQAAPDCTFVSFDYAQMELRVLAHLSGDEVLCRSFDKGEDRLTRLSQIVFQSEVIREEQRAATKQILYGVLYGMGDQTLQSLLPKSNTDLRTQRLALLSSFPGLKRFQENVVDHARALGSIITLGGRPRRFTERGLELRRRVLSTVVQGSAADILKAALVASSRALAARPDLCAVLSHSVHDELVFVVPEVQLHQVVPVLVHALEKEVLDEFSSTGLSAGTFKPPLVVNVKVGQSFDKMIPYKSP